MNRISARRGIAAVPIATLLGTLLAAPFAAQTHAARHARRAIGQIPRPPAIRIRLVDFAGLSPKVRAAAEAPVIRIFRQAGVEIAFVECLDAAASAPCRQPPGPTDLWLQILNRAPHRLLGDDATGFTVLVHSPQAADSYAAISYPRVLAAADDLDVDATEVLAASMAHEIGHLLLNSGAHSRTGVMSPRIDRRQIAFLQRGELLFTADQAARLAAAIRPAVETR
jgi:hypothetical protein